MVLIQDDTSWHAVNVAAYLKLLTTELQAMPTRKSMPSKIGLDQGLHGFSS